MCGNIKFSKFVFHVDNALFLVKPTKFRNLSLFPSSSKSIIHTLFGPLNGSNLHPGAGCRNFVLSNTKETEEKV